MDSLDQITTFEELRIAVERHMETHPTHGTCTCLDEAVRSVRRGLGLAPMYDSALDSNPDERVRRTQLRIRVGYILRLAMRPT